MAGPSRYRRDCPSSRTTGDNPWAYLLRFRKPGPNLHSKHGTGASRIIKIAQAVIVQSNPIPSMRLLVNNGKKEEKRYRIATSTANAEAPSSAP